MFKVFGFFLSIISFATIAETHIGTIEHIDYPQEGESETLLYLSDASVVKLSEQKNTWIYEQAYTEGKTLRIRTDENRVIESAEEFSEPQHVDEKSYSKEYTPSVLASANEANTIFKRLRRDYTFYSQCYNRAHIWAYEAKNKFNLDSMKAFMFFTRRYIREFNFEWWFHVAPYTYIRTESGTEERVLDPRFTKAPLSMKAWTDQFMKNKVTCPVITKYSEYSRNQENQYCYLYKASMYYVQPLDLENLEKTGKTKTEFLNYEIKRAYRNGFGAWF